MCCIYDCGDLCLVAMLVCCFGILLYGLMAVLMFGCVLSVVYVGFSNLCLMLFVGCITLCDLLFCFVVLVRCYECLLVV